MNNAIEIERGIAPPSKTELRMRFDAMEVNDCFYIPIKGLDVTIDKLRSYMHDSLFGRKFKTRTSLLGIKVWRLR